MPETGACIEAARLPAAVPSHLGRGGMGSLQEDVAGNREKRIFQFRIRSRHFSKGSWTIQAAREPQLQFFFAGKRAPQQVDNIHNALGLNYGVSRRSPESDKEAHMSGYAVANSTETRQVNKQPLLENRWHGIVEISGLGKSPQLFGDLRRFGSEAKKVWKDSEAAFNPRGQSPGKGFWQWLSVSRCHCVPGI